MRKWWMAGAVLLVLGSCWGCGVSGTAETPAVLETEALEKTDLSSEAATEVSGQETAEADETVSEPELTMGDGLEASRWCGRYFRKGNFSWQLAPTEKSGKSWQGMPGFTGLPPQRNLPAFENRS